MIQLRARPGFVKRAASAFGFVVVERHRVELEPMIDQPVAEPSRDLGLQALDFFGLELDDVTGAQIDQVIMMRVGDLRVTIRNVGKVPAVSVRSMSSTRWGPPDSVAWLGDVDAVDPSMQLDIGPGCFTPVVYPFTPPSDDVLPG